MESWHELSANLSRYRETLFAGRLAWIPAMLAASLGAWWSNAPELLRVLGMLAPGLFVLDLATGIARSVLAEKRSVCSEALGRSLVKAFVYLSLFLLCFALDLAVRTGYAAQLALLVFVVVREAHSNLENLAALRGLSGVEIPGFIKEGFDRLGKEKEDEDRH